MKKQSTSALLFALVFLVALPAVVHSVLEGPYVVNPEGYRRTFWIGAVSTTIPYAALAVLFLAHTALLKSRSPVSAYLGAVMAWLSMMGFTIFLVNQVSGPKYSSTMGIAVALTPFFYIPFLFLPYLVGALVGMIVGQKKTTEVSNKPAGGDA